ncbi:hypothetical protein HPB50_029385 [Hyalomma asiaticum]|nr:hypothetical protein HPB50_029385 [Hyalomma asiaticum]
MGVSRTVHSPKLQQQYNPAAPLEKNLTDAYKNSETILEKIIAQTQHVALRLRTMYVIDQFACEVKDPLVVAHWACLSSPTHNSVKINILSQGYETMCR